MPAPNPPKGRPLELTRRARRILALRELGISADARVVFRNQRETLGYENHLRSLPEDTSLQFPMQNSSGYFRFIPGFSEPDSPDWL